MRLTRRRLLLLGSSSVAAALAAARYGLPRLWRARPLAPLEGEVKAFVEHCFEGLDRSAMWDVHAHLVGLGAGGTGCEVSAKMRSHRHPILRFQYEVYTAAAGIESEEDADRQYRERLLRLHRAANPEGKLVLLAFDRRVDESGRELPEDSPFYTPNEYALQLAREHEDVEACVSIHPYRRDAIERLDAAVAAGARAVKWLPNTMAIDPASKLCDPFYERLAELGLPLLTHAGLELAAESSGLQALGNPLRLRRPLEAGVRVVVAHFGSLGESADLDAETGPSRASFDLCMRLFRESRWEDRLFADISAITFLNRTDGPLPELLRAGEVHGRLVNGSDYPLPAVDPVISTWWLQHRGLLDPEDRRLCNAVFDANPLLFDFVLKRAVRVRDGGVERRFADGVFETAWLYDAGSGSPR